MLGAIIGDLTVSRDVWEGQKVNPCPEINDDGMLMRYCFLTDASIMSLAIAKALLECGCNEAHLRESAAHWMEEIGRNYSCCQLVQTADWTTYPWESYYNDAVKRVSACGIVAKSMDEAIVLSRRVTEVTHNNQPECIKDAEATTAAIFLAKTGHTIPEIKDYIDKHYYPMNFTVKGERILDGEVKHAIMAFLESTSFEDAIHNAGRIYSDNFNDTMEQVTGSIAEAYYGIPAGMRSHALTFLDERLLNIVEEFENKFPPVQDKQTRAGEAAVKHNENEKSGVRKKTMRAAKEDLLSSFADNDKAVSRALATYVFHACNFLGGVTNKDEFKNYIIPIMLLKRLCDVYDEEIKHVMDESDGDYELAESPENHRFIIPERCHWDYLRFMSEDDSAAARTVIVKAMSGIEKANGDALHGVFSGFDYTNWTDESKLSDERLMDVVWLMTRINLGNDHYTDDIMSDSYEYLIKKFADLSKKKAGGFYTPRPVVKLLVKLLAPKPGESVYDPACGTGGMLIEAIHYMHDDKGAHGKLFGQDINPATASIARINLILHKAPDFQITQGDTLCSPGVPYRGELKTFDCVISNPPFSTTDSNADIAWLRHMVESTDPQNGRCAVVLSQSILLSGGKEGEMCRQLIKSDKLECVITLAGNLFYEAGISACLLLLNNHKPTAHKGKVCLIDASGICTAIGAKNVMTAQNVDEVYGLYASYVDLPEKCKIVTIEDLAKGLDLAGCSYM